MLDKQKWYVSPIALTGILSQLVLVAGLFLTVDHVNIIQVIGAAVIAVIGIIAARNNPTNPNGWGAN